MKKNLLTLMLLPAVAWAQGENNELAQCRQIFLDNMEAMELPLHCSQTPPAQTAPQEKLDNHLRQVLRCGHLLRTRYAADREAMAQELDAYVAQVAATVRQAQATPQDLQRFCEAQHRKAYETLMRY